MPDKLRQRLQLSFGADNYSLLALVTLVIAFQVCSPEKLELWLQNELLLNILHDIGKCNYTFEQFIQICSSSDNQRLSSVIQHYDPNAPKLEASFPGWETSGTPVLWAV